MGDPSYRIFLQTEAFTSYDGALFSVLSVCLPGSATDLAVQAAANDEDHETSLAILGK